ncbi:MAG: class I mannose-6-phosphate isomerase [Phycisphaeraceae bacterium]|nr:class I mannose-6-phosphate isomerase [Phycisphaeraceae bacterium]
MTDLSTPLYPMLFEPIYKQKVWGGRRLEQLGRPLPGDANMPIGESWELADLSASSPDGGGGGQQCSIIANGPLAGETLHDLIGAFGPRLMGQLTLDESGQFPLLVKFLDASANLSVQVHPSQAYLDAHPHAVAHLKSEAWYIVAAEPGSVIYKGVRAGVTPEQFRAAIDDESLETLLLKVPVKAGNCHYLPSGMCHALGAGVLVAEIQTPSDTTFRVYDWGRPEESNRSLHIDEAMQCIDVPSPDTAANEKRTHLAGMFTTMSRLITCEHFQIEKVRMSQGYAQPVPYDQPTVWVVLEGKGVIDPGGGARPVEFSHGQTLLLPAQMAEPTVELTMDTVWLEITKRVVARN